MLVIPQQVLAGPLPQPAGPSIPSPTLQPEHHDQFGHLRNNEASCSSPKTPPVHKGMAPPPQGTKPLGRNGTFARAQTMMTPGTSREMGVSAGASASSRSTSPLSSIPSSCRSSPRIQAALASSVTNTPTSTNPSSIGSSDPIGIKTTRQRARASSDMANPAGKGKQAVIDDPAAIPYEIPDMAIPPFARKTRNAQRDLGRVWEAVAGARRIAVVTGAGISVSSPANIPDFRSTAGLFRKLKEKHPNAGLSSGKDLFDANLFKSPSTSALFYSMVAELKAMADAAQPTSFHHLLKRLDLEGRLQRVYTQNIDGLEEKAGLTFGLGETADSRAALRALGKRKREAGHGSGLLRQGSMARSKSDSAVLLSRDTNALLSEPMFPRSIPLHGSLSTMTCHICGHKVYLSLASSGQQTMPRIAGELSPDAGNHATAAMDLLSQGEPVPCKQCEEFAGVRSSQGLRSRGVGLMKVDVVLYNGQNEGAERVGDCLERDILGLRDPNETSVPESHRERIARERRERKELTQSIVAGSVLQPIQEAGTAEDAFASAFAEDDASSDTFFTNLMKPTPLVIEKPKRQQRLKPLPPDLLIVAGTSLKVPGTKRIVREFAKACQAQDHCVCDESSEEGSDDENSSSNRKARSKQRSRSTTPKASKRDGKVSKSEEDVGSEEEEEEDDINAPIRTILLNYDFPLPHSSWEDVFDVWVQGDVQQAALGLWEASSYPAEAALKDFSMQSDGLNTMSGEGFSWASYVNILESERKAEKKAASKKPSDSQGSTGTAASGSQKQTKKGSTTGRNDKAPQSPKKPVTKEHISASPKKGATMAKKSTKSASKATESPVKKKTKEASSTVKKANGAASVRPPKATSLSKHVKVSKKADSSEGRAALVAATDKSPKKAKAAAHSAARPTATRIRR